MKAHVQVAVIGGGVVGASVLYHLTKLGWRDVVLIERRELTAGSTWHAAGGMHTLNGDANLARLQGYTIRLYRALERESGQICGLHACGGLYLAATPDRLDYLRALAGKGRHLGLDYHLISPAEAKALNPLIDERHFLGALYDPEDGHVDPAGVTHAYAKAARQGGAEIYRQTRVEALSPAPGGGWSVATDKGTLHAEVVVNAAGLWAREVAAMVGLRLPLLPMEHQYLVTDAIPAVMALDREPPNTIDFEGESYLRQEQRGLLIGTYEWDCRPWSAGGTSWDFGDELLPPDLDRLSDRLATAFARIPCLAEAGIRRVVNGPMMFAPDGNPLIGPVAGLPGYFLACGVMAGFSQGGGVGLAVAQWIVDGAPADDVFAMDVARYGDWATTGWVAANVTENYRRRFAIAYPNEELPAARPHLKTPVYDDLAAAGAVFGASAGLEHALWFAPPGVERAETPTFRRSNAFNAVADEVESVREHAGLLEIAGYAKYAVSGRGAAAWLDRLLAGRLPRPGRIRLAPMLAPSGRLLGDFTVACLAPDRFFLVGSGAAEAFHRRWFAQQVGDAPVEVRSETLARPGFALAGPQAKAVLRRLADIDALPFMGVAETTVAGLPALVARISYTGELGYEIYVDAVDQPALLRALRQAGESVGLRLFGARALNALRLEKGYGAWLRDVTPDYTPRESGLDRFVAAGKGAFVGRDAFLAAPAPARVLRLLAIEATDADAWGNEPVLRGDEAIGFVTSGGYGHHVGLSLALAYLPPDIGPDEPLAVAILGGRRPARILPQVPHDPAGKRMRD